MADKDAALGGVEAANAGGAKTSTSKPKKKAPIGDTYGIKLEDETRPGLRLNDRVDDYEAGMTASWIRPAYFDGDEWTMFQGESPEVIANIQRALAAAGLLDGDLADGAWMDESASAFKKVLAHANRTGITWDQALTEIAGGRIAARGPARGGGSGRAPFQARLSNPEDLREVFKQSAYNLLGGKGFVDDQQLDQMVSAYHQIETSSQRAAYGGGTAVDAPGPDTFAEGQLEELDPEGVKAGRTAGFVGVLEGLLRNG